MVRKSKRSTRRRQRGGFVEMPSTASNLQGQNFLSKHEGQRGGMANINHNEALPTDLHGAARLTGLDASFAAIQGMKDQAGGRKQRQSKHRKVHGGSRKGSKKSRKTRRSRRMRGGDAPVTDSPMLLSGGQEASAVAQMNPEWKLAENPSAFTPTRS